jgi:hypothetical protein
MSLAKNFYDASAKPKAKTRNLVSTIAGIVTFALSLLVTFNVLDLDQSATLQGYATTLLEAGVAVYGVVVGIINMFFTVDPPTEPVV